MFDRILATALTSLLCFAALTHIHAQDSNQSKDDTAASRFAKIQQAWDENEKSMELLIESYRTTDPEEQPALKELYETKIQKANALVLELRIAAIAAYEEAPNADEKVVNALVGLMANDVRMDKYEGALELGHLLLKNNCKVTAINSLVGSAAYSMDDFETANEMYKRATDAGSLSQSAAADFRDIETALKSWEREQSIRKAEAAANDLPRVMMQTSKGELLIELYENEAPQTVGNFVSLVEKQYYDGLTFHRVLPGFMAQGGCPDGSGSGNPGYKIFCECDKEDIRHHFRGTLSMAHAGPNTGGSQFFLTFRRTSHLDGKHTVFGRVIEGHDVLAKLQRINPRQPSGATPDRILKAVVIRKRNHEYSPAKVGE